MSFQLPVRIRATGKYLPSRVVHADEIDRQMGTAQGWTLEHVGVERRHFADGESLASMGAKAAKQAMQAAELRFEEIDVIVCAGASKSQIIPCNAALLQKELGAAADGIPSYDLNSTCLSFVVAFENLGAAIAAGRYRRALIVSAEKASIGIDYSHPESGALFGDGAGAVILERDDSGQSGVLAAKMATYSEGAHDSEVLLGSDMLESREEVTKDAWKFRMKGPRLVKLTLKKLRPFLDSLFEDASVSLDDIDLCIPHQASLPALTIVRKYLKLSEEQFYIFVQNHGNMIAASIPIGIHNAVYENRLRRGDLALLLGTSAGFSIGATLLRF